VVRQQNADIADNPAPKGIAWVHMCATWRIRLNPPCVAAMRPYVKLLWPLAINKNSIIITVVIANIFPFCNFY